MLRIVGRFPSKNLQTKSRRILEFKLYKSVRCYSKDVCPPPPPKRKDKSSSGALYTLGALALVGGATIGYAKYDPDFRKTLGEYVPWTDDVIKFVFQEEHSLLDSASGVYEDVKKSVSGLLTQEQRKKKEDVKLEQKQYKGGEAKVPPGEVSVPESHPSNLAELEAKICDAATEAVNFYNKAVYDLRVYNGEISQILDQSVDQVKPPQWEALKAKTKAKNESVRLAEEKAAQAAQNVSKLKTLLTKTSAATKEMVNINIDKVQEDIDAAKAQYEIERKLGSITDKYWEKVQKARHHFCEELESLFPAIDIYNKKLEVNEADLDLFILHAYSVVLYYQKELAKLETVAHEKLQSALDAARRGGFEPLGKAQICEAIEEEKRKLTLCFQKQCLKLRKEAEHELREQLKRQSQVFADHLDEAVTTRALEIERVLSRKFDEEMEKERFKHKSQLAAMVGRMKGLDHAFKARDAADKAAKQSQVLWAACQALLRAIKTGCPGIPWKDQLRPLSPEITLVQKAAAKGDELVEAVINGIPKEAKERGVFPEDALRERFLKVEDVARRVALVPEEGGALPLHILSYIQAFFLIKNPSPIPQAELNDEAVDFSQLSTNEILQRARYWLDRGDFAQTLKYMNLLQGAPRSIARQWMNETRILLETQQAANTLMAHAASSGLLHL
ncbi:MICOS complex subunit Mic60 isoform X2 [Tribolium castaneum]|uniref:MICOS complex subunit Mic60 isoform X2 n=1 Tax=Tribolium castaneum TaxID=7070 RepID=UPI00046C1270|nr:PREDICTED: MICOS complex subunit Mic60 isoform X2 [Tribolium castaneum]|eukprot:XP_008198305.1 PREDICTED: MICOS complex subunit Mic60 isoform X2 [Tribolium castaneum]